MTVCFYHKGCMDGFGAAWTVYKALGKNVEFIPVTHGDPVPEMEYQNETVFIVDFSWPRQELELLAAKSVEVIVLDHHKTAQAELESLPYAYFDMSKSGAVMAWDYVFPGSEVPLILKYVQDRDLWKWELNKSKEINAALYSYPMDFDTWDWLAEGLQESFSTLCSEGSAILRMERKHIDSLMFSGFVETVDILGYTVPLLNCPRWLGSDVLNRLCTLHPEYPFAASYFDTEKDRLFELRSVGEFDVSTIAKQLGGGGHRNAAGFSLNKYTLFNLKM